MVVSVIKRAEEIVDSVFDLDPHVRRIAIREVADKLSQALIDEHRLLSRYCESVSNACREYGESGGKQERELAAIAGEIADAFNENIANRAARLIEQHESIKSEIRAAGLIPASR